MLLSGLRVILVRTRFPENIGMAARACANMGCSRLDLVEPERWDREKARPLATPKALPLLDALTVHPSLDDALTDCTCVIGTTARRGGWRRHILTPSEAAEMVAERITAGEKVALVFGPEDRGLENKDIMSCLHLVSIPTDSASSLNLAQAVLLMLYVCAEKVRGAVPNKKAKTISHAELELLLEHFREALLRLDCLHGDNCDYFFLPWKQLFGRMELRRSEFDALMGLCRQIQNRIPPNDTGIS